MHREIVTGADGVRIILVDSISQLEDTDAGAVVIAGSNGGQESGHVGTAARCGFVLLNDAGIGKDAAGIAGLEILEQAGIPAAAVSHDSAEISNARDMWDNGVISVVNPAARELGVTPGDHARPAVLALAATYSVGGR